MQFSSFQYDVLVVTLSSQGYPLQEGQQRKRQKASLLHISSILKGWTPLPLMHFDVSSLRRYRFCVGLCRNFGKCMEVIVKKGKTNTWGKTKTDKDKKVE